MAEQCKKCGAEVFSNMRFCRFCGAPTGALSPEEDETQPFSSLSATQQHASTVTSPVYLSPEMPAAYQPASLERPPRKRRWPWIVGFIFGFFVLILGAAGYGIYRFSQMPGVDIQETEGGFVITKDGKRVATIGINKDQEATSETDATIVRTIPFSPGGTFSLTTDLGDVDIVAWDRDEILIEGEKHQASSRERRELRAEIDTSDPNRVVVRTVRPDDSRAHIDYKIKVPRHVNIGEITTAQGHVEIDGLVGNIAARTTSDHIKIKNVQGNVSVESLSGDIEIERVVGFISTKTVSGESKARLGPGADAKNASFETISGDLSIRFDDPFDADLEISTTTGDIHVRGNIQVAIEEGIAHKSAQGHVGQGGNGKIDIKTVSGDIRLSH